VVVVAAEDTWVHGRTAIQQANQAVGRRQCVQHVTGWRWCRPYKQASHDMRLAGIQLHLEANCTLPSASPSHPCSPQHLTSKYCAREMGLMTNGCDITCSREGGGSGATDGDKDAAAMCWLRREGRCRVGHAFPNTYTLAAPPLIHDPPPPTPHTSSDCHHQHLLHASPARPPHQAGAPALQASRRRCNTTGGSCLTRRSLPLLPHPTQRSHTHHKGPTTPQPRWCPPPTWAPL
jgi:hypothetical protein